MSVDDDSANVFATPDFWEPAQWEPLKDDTGFFALDLKGAPPLVQQSPVSDIQTNRIIPLVQPAQLSAERTLHPSHHRSCSGAGESDHDGHTTVTARRTLDRRGCGYWRVMDCAGDATAKGVGIQDMERLRAPRFFVNKAFLHNGSWARSVRCPD